MRLLAFIGATTVALVLSGASANALGNISPSESPYAILEPQTVAPTTPIEGRSVYSGDNLTPRVLGAPYEAPRATTQTRRRRLREPYGR